MGDQCTGVRGVSGSIRGGGGITTFDGVSFKLRKREDSEKVLMPLSYSTAMQLHYYTDIQSNVSIIFYLNSMQLLHLKLNLIQLCCSILHYSGLVGTETATGSL